MDSKIAIETIAPEDADNIEEFLTQFFYNVLYLKNSYRLSNNVNPYFIRHIQFMFI